MYDGRLAVMLNLLSSLNIGIMIIILEEQPDQDLLCL